jgi:hypothetical protein
MDDSEQETGEHEPNSYVRVDSRPAVIHTIEITDLVTQP